MTSVFRTLWLKKIIFLTKTISKSHLLKELKELCASQKRKKKKKNNKTKQKPGMNYKPWGLAV